MAESLIFFNLSKKKKNKKDIKYNNKKGYHKKIEVI